MNVDITQFQLWIEQLVAAIKSGNLAAIIPVLFAGWVLYRKWKGQPVAPVTPAAQTDTGNKKIDAALTLLNSEPTSPAEKALVKAVAERHGTAK